MKTRAALATEPAAPIAVPPAYCFFHVFEPMAPTVRTFDRDYLLYAISGAVRLGVEGRRWLLPPAFAAWVPADTPVEIEMSHPVTSCSVLFERGFIGSTDPALPTRTVVFTMSPLAREMVAHCRRWGPDTMVDRSAETFFRALAQVCAELASRPSDVWRPYTADPALARAIAFTDANLERDLKVKEVAAAACMSERTLLRRYATETGMTWAHSLRRLRMIRAVELLTTTNASVATIANQVGYSALSAFNGAFRDFAGTTPTAMRRDWTEVGERVHPREGGRAAP